MKKLKNYKIINNLKIILNLREDLLNRSRSCEEKNVDVIGLNFIKFREF